jgi:hypothetical protein
MGHLRTSKPDITVNTPSVSRQTMFSKIHALTGVTLLTLLFLYSTAPSQAIDLAYHPKNPQAWRKLEDIKHDSSSVKFRPIHAHVADPRTHKIFLHNASSDSATDSGSQAYFDVQATDLDAAEAMIMASVPSLQIATRRQLLTRPSTPIHYLNQTRSQRIAFNAAIQWEDTEVEVPDVTDRETLKTLAKMASNAYVTPESTEWWGLDEWNMVSCSWSVRIGMYN